MRSDLHPEFWTDLSNCIEYSNLSRFQAFLDIKLRLRHCPEEYAIHDYEGFKGVRIEEYTGIDTLTAIAAFLAEHRAVGAEVLKQYCGDLEEAREAMEDRHLGSFTSLADYVQEVTEETMTIPQAL